VLLNEPRLEVITDYEEIDIPPEYLEGYEPPQPEPEPVPELPQEEPTAAFDLKTEKVEKLKALTAYDTSSAVNSFIVQMPLGGEIIEQSTWIDAGTRTVFGQSITAAKLLGKATVALPLLGRILTLPTSWAEMAIALIQSYADEAAVVTATHKLAIEALNEVAAVVAYDFTTGYPEKIVINLNEITL
jgi:hypothetical protein